MRVIFSVFVRICVCICNFLDGGTRSKKKYFMKFYEFYELMIFFYELMNWWKNGEVLIIDNHCAPSLSEGEWKKSELINYKGWQWVHRDLIQTTFSSEWRGCTVPETWPVSFVLWPGSASSHKFCEQGHSLDRNWVTFKLASYQSVHCICKFICICTHCKLYLHFVHQ